MHSLWSLCCWHISCFSMKLSCLSKILRISKAAIVHFVCRNFCCVRKLWLALLLGNHLSKNFRFVRSMELSLRPVVSTMPSASRVLRVQCALLKVAPINSFFWYAPSCDFNYEEVCAVQSDCSDCSLQLSWDSWTTSSVRQLWLYSLVALQRPPLIISKDLAD